MSFKRFTYWKVFWVVLSCYVLILLLGVIATATSQEEIDLRSFFKPWHLISQFINVVVDSLFFFFSLNIYHSYCVNKKNFTSYLRISFLLIIPYVAYLIAKHKWFPSTYGTHKMTASMLTFYFTMFILIRIGLSLLIAYFNYLRDEKKQQKVLEGQKMQLEIEKSSANLNFLKAQINPHFLHNTLNFLYAKSLPYSPELSEGILTLSDIMRYALSEPNARDGKAPLKDEIEHVWNVIKINQLRFSNKLNVDLQVNGIVNGIHIIPFVLITIVENAFKHGDLKSQEYPIEIRINIEKDRLQFYCRNRKKTGPKELSTGVGLDNIKKRLELAYGENYHLDIQDEQEFYSTNLTIDKL